MVDLCLEPPLAQQAYAAFVLICQGMSDDAGTYETDEAIVRAALKRLDELERFVASLPLISAHDMPLPTTTQEPTP